MSESESDDPPEPEGPVHQGKPPSDFQAWSRTDVFFHDFANISDMDYSPVFSCLGHTWFVSLFPDLEEEGCNESRKGMVSFYLRHEGPDFVPIRIEFGIAVKDCSDNKIADHVNVRVYTFRTIGRYDVCNTNFIPRQRVLKNLVNGTLVMEVRMRLAESSQYPFIPTNPSVCKTVQELFMDEESADVVFEVGREFPKSSRHRAKKQQKTERTTSSFHAHSLILKKAAPLLADLCISDQPLSIIPIPSVSPDTFRHLLHYIYGHDISEFLLDISHTKEIIDAADRYGVTNLKLEAEACYVSEVTLTLENVMDHLQYADAKNCALLKEAVIKFIIANRVDIIKRKIVTDATGGISNDILSMMAVESGKENELCLMSISELRLRASNFGLDVDGSRETLIESLKQYDKA